MSCLLNKRHFKAKKKPKNQNPQTNPKLHSRRSGEKLVSFAKKLGFCFLSPEFQAQKGQTSHRDNCSVFYSCLIARFTRFAIPAHYTNPRLLCSCQIHSLLLLSASVQAETTDAGHAGRPGLRQGTPPRLNSAPASRLCGESLSSHHPRLHPPHLKRQAKETETHPKELVS